MNDTEMDLTIRYQNKSKRKTLAKFCFNLDEGNLRLKSDPLTESEMVIMIAILRDCADAIETELDNGHFEVKH